MLTMQSPIVATVPPKSEPRTNANAIMLVRVAVGDADLQAVERLAEETGVIIAAVGGAVVAHGIEPPSACGGLRAIICLLVFLAVRGHIVHAHAVDGMAGNARAAVDGIVAVALGHIVEPSVLDSMHLILERAAIDACAQQVVLSARIPCKAVVPDAEVRHLVQPTGALEVEGVVDRDTLARCL